MLDAERQIRFLYPPVFFIASLMLGVRLDPHSDTRSVANALFGSDVANKLINADWGQVVVAFAAAAGLIAMIALGFLISSIAVLFLRAIIPTFTQLPYEAHISDDALKAIRHRIGAQNPKKRNADALYLSATLDHGGIIPDGVHRWVFRRWSIFCVASNSIAALVLAFICGGFLGLRSLSWVAATLIGVAILIPIAVAAYHDTMGMIRFQALLLPARSVGAQFE